MRAQGEISRIRKRITYIHHGLGMCNNYVVLGIEDERNKI